MNSVATTQHSRIRLACGLPVLPSCHVVNAIRHPAQLVIQPAGALLLRQITGVR